MNLQRRLAKIGSRRWLYGFPAGLCLSLLLTATLASCADNPKAASKDNFRIAIQQALADQPKCLPPSFPTFGPDPQPRGEPKEQMAALISQGLVATHPIKVQAVFFGWMKSTNSQGSPGLEYDLTSQGHKYQRTVTLPMERPQTKLCYAEPEVTAIESYTEPAPFLGVVVTHVTYQYRLAHFAPWAQQPGVVKAFHLESELDLLTHPQRGEMPLLLTSDGWRSHP